mgnify:CR=1 FL=1
MISSLTSNDSTWSKVWKEDLPEQDYFLCFLKCWSPCFIDFQNPCNVSITSTIDSYFNDSLLGSKFTRFVTIFQHEGVGYATYSLTRIALHTSPTTT